MSVTLYDIPSKEGTCWSLNPWKPRLALNYKGIPYSTEWIEYPDIAPKLKAFGIAAKEKGTAYTSPAVRMPDGTYLQDTANILPAFEKLKPEPSLHLDSPMNERVSDAFSKINPKLAPIWMVRVPEQLLNPPSAEYFHRTRSETVGCPLDELAKSDKAKNAWNEARPGLEELKKLIHEDESGPYFLGKTPSYADFIAVGAFEFYKRHSSEDLFQEIMKFDEGFSKLYQACEEWLQKAD